MYFPKMITNIVVHIENKKRSGLATIKTKATMINIKAINPTMKYNKFNKTSVTI